MKVNPTLEVQGHPGIFAAGDIIEWKEQKQAGKAPAHAGVAAANVLSFLDGRERTKKYKGFPEIIVLPIGKVQCACSPLYQGTHVDILHMVLELWRDLHRAPLGYCPRQLVHAVGEGQGPSSFHVQGQTGVLARDCSSLSSLVLHWASQSPTLQCRLHYCSYIYTVRCSLFL